MVHIALGRSFQNVAVVEMWCTSSSVVVPCGCEVGVFLLNRASSEKEIRGWLAFCWRNEVGADVGVGGLFHFCAIYRHLR